MPDETTPSSLPPTSSSPPSPRSSPSAAACWAAHLTSLAVALAVAIPVGRALPGLIELATKGEWKPAAAALLALGMVAAPADVLQLAKGLLPGALRRPDGK